MPQLGDNLHCIKAMKLRRVRKKIIAVKTITKAN